MLSTINKLTKDARFYQIFYLGIFLIYGINELNWEFKPLIILSYILTGILTQIIAIKIYNLKYDSLKSALITTLGLSILLKTEYCYIAALASFLAISSKFILKYNGKHIFNPANFGIIATVYLTKMAWTSPGQWGSSLVLLYFIGAAGSMILLKVGRMDTGFTFLISYAIIQFCYTVLFLNWPIDQWLHKLTSGVLLLYAFFMITDPATTPNHFKLRTFWAICIAFFTFYLTEFHYVNGSPIKALFLFSVLTPLIDKLYKAPSFNWKTSLKF